MRSGRGASRILSRAGLASWRRGRARLSPRCAEPRNIVCDCDCEVQSCWPHALAHISVRKGSRANTSGRRCSWPRPEACCNRHRCFPFIWSPRALAARRRLVYQRRGTNRGLTCDPPRPEHLDLGMGALDLRPSRPPGPTGPAAGTQTQGQRPRRPSRPTGRARELESSGARASGLPSWSWSEVGPRPSSRRRDMAQAQARRGPRPSIAMRSGCSSTCSTSPPHWHKTRWSSTWPDASARRPANGDRSGPGTTPRTPLTSSTTLKIV